MLHVTQFAGGSVPDGALRGMFAARKSVFVDLLKWDVPVLHGEFEIDQFDDGNARYLILTGPEGRHLASARLLPTTRAHILDSLYPELCEDAPPRGPHVFEITRFCLDRRLRAPERRAVRDTLVVALADYALAHGITHYTAIAELPWFQQILSFGWRCLPLGLPRTVGTRALAALEIAIAPDTPALLAAAGVQARPTALDIDQRAAA